MRYLVRIYIYGLSQHPATAPPLEARPRRRSLVLEQDVEDVPLVLQVVGVLQQLDHGLVVHRTGPRHQHLVPLEERMEVAEEERRRMRTGSMSGVVIATPRSSSPLQSLQTSVTRETGRGRVTDRQAETE